MQPHEGLVDAISSVIDTYRDKVCSRCKKALFHVRKGCLSEYAIGIELYREKGTDRNGFIFVISMQGARVQCSEGGCHRTLSRSFGSFNGSYELGDSILGIQRFRANVDALH